MTKTVLSLAVKWMMDKYRASLRFILAVTVLLGPNLGLSLQTGSSPNPPDPNAQYSLGPDSEPQPGVPKGKIFEFVLDKSKIFPGTTRKITVYVPAQYRPDRPACVYVGLDGLQFRAPIVFDNLIYKHEMPVTIAIGVQPGTLESIQEHHAIAVPKTAKPSDLDGVWVGLLDTDDEKIPLVLRVGNSQTGLSATLDSPSEYLYDLPVTDIERLGSSVNFKVAAVHVDFSGSFDVKENTVTGKWKQSGHGITLALSRLKDAALEPHSTDDPRFNRSFEFDSLNNNLARFLLDEVFPAVELQKTPDGLPIRLSQDPNDRAVGGASTGGIASFTVAWENPDAFRRVFTAIGTFVGMRGGDRYPVLVRKTEPKPIRIFMQDGSNDELNSWLGEIGDWWMSNQTMERALEFAGYDVRHVWGEGSHSGQHATAIFPDVMRWLWRDWPEPIKARESHNVFLQAILKPGEAWTLVPGSYQANGVLAVNSRGRVFFEDASSQTIRELLPDGELVNHPELGSAATALAFGADGAILIGHKNNVIHHAVDGRTSVVAEELYGRYILAAKDGSLYVIDPGRSVEDGRVWLIAPDGKRSLLDSGLYDPGSIAISPDGLWISVVENKTHWGYSYRVQAHGNLDQKQKFYWFHVPDSADDSGADGSAMDQDGRLYVATRMGVQIFDHNGRSRVILPVPGGEVHGLAFGGSHYDRLYVSCADHKIYSRELKISGAPSWADRTNVPMWGPG